jgi:hypothetical protein
MAYWDAAFLASPADADLISEGAGKIRELKDAIHDGSWVSHIGTALFATAAEVTAGTESGKAIAPDHLAEAGIRAAVLPTNHLSGLALSNAADTEHDLTIAVGKARDATDAVDMTLASALTKQGDAEWAVGTAAGGFAAGESMPATGTVHVWIIKRSDTGVVDVLFNDHATTALTPTLPANYDYKRLIGSYRTSSSHFINGDWWGTGLNRTFMFDTPILDVSTASPGTNAVTAALSTPGGIVVNALLNTSQGTNGLPYISSLTNADLAPSLTVAPLASSGSSGNIADKLEVFTNTSSQIRYRCLSDVAIYIATIGYEMSL